MALLLLASECWVAHGFSSSSCEWELFILAVHGLLIEVASLIAEHGL